MIRIIAGKHKNRMIPIRKKAKYRPATGKMREAIFSIIASADFMQDTSLENKNVLDLFTGTGSIAFEALSRGANKIGLIDNIPEYIKDAQAFAELIGESENVRCWCMNAASLPKASAKYDIIFVNPPYSKGLVVPALNSLIKGNWLNDDAVIFTEIGKREKIDIPASLTMIRERIYGISRLIILKYRAS